MSENLLPASLVTGATAGIGWELTRLLAKPGSRIVAVGRRADRLADLESICLRQGCEFLSVPADLIEPGAIAAIMSTVGQKGWRIEKLYNNAGFGAIGAFWELPWERQRDILRLNAESATELVYAVLPTMMSHNQGRIVNISSLGGFSPGPFQSVYYASKAYFNSFSVALAEELRSTSIDVVTVCPGPTRTEFQQVAGFIGSSTFPPQMTALEVAQVIANSERGVVVPGWANWIIAKFFDLVPLNFKAYLMANLGRKRRKS